MAPAINHIGQKEFVKFNLKTVQIHLERRTKAAVALLPSSVSLMNKKQPSGYLTNRVPLGC
ncbi:hypothetical protein CBW46_012755 [Paenibacillus xerothermodurans]|uniref:Uncharacterized protein n=1 Tax=Paenibacillus xerothermodurans TaxID=1977292 RepID=A0A2W1NAD0_PAEXE|nr:hypothetical protein CBW46_012755 [Paenibacillus xerothermodurans]